MTDTRSPIRLSVQLDGDHAGYFAAVCSCGHQETMVPSRGRAELRGRVHVTLAHTATPVNVQHFYAADVAASITHQ